MADLQGLDYFRASDAWEDTQVADWTKVDAYVDHGWLTEEDREYLHAYGSMVALNPNSSSNDFSETNDAWSKYLDVKEEHGDDPLFNKDVKAEDIPRPEIGDGPKDGEDYSKDGPTEEADAEEPPVADPPAVPGGEDGGNGGPGKISVNTAALKKFADNVESLRVMVENSNTHTANIDILPGGFHAAYELRKKIMGDGQGAAGLKADTEQYVKKLVVSLANIRDEVRKLVVDYDNAEDLNKITTEKLNTIMSDSFKFVGAGSPPPGA